MTSDKNKNISQIQYNHLNLPSKIQWQNGNNIVYQYNAAGIKISKVVKESLSITQTLYLDGYQYVNGNLEFFPVAGAYVKKTENIGATKRWYDYVFNYTDHLGNIRLSYTLDYNTNKLKTLEENHYYPFGLKHRKYNNLLSDIKFKPNISNRGLTPIVKGKTYKYKYQGQERQDELNLNWDSFKWRNYDFTIGRFMSVDPLAEQTGYAYVGMNNNPINVIDPDGRKGTDWYKEKGTENYTWINGSGEVEGYEHLGYDFHEYGFDDRNTPYYIEGRGATKTLVTRKEGIENRYFFESKKKHGLSDEAIAFLRDPTPDAVEIYASHSTPSTGVSFGFTGSLLITKSGEVGVSASPGSGVSTDIMGGTSFGVAFHWSKRLDRRLNVKDFNGFESNTELSIPLQEFGIPGDANVGIVEGKFNSGMSMGFSPGKVSIPSVSYEGQYGYTRKLFNFN